MSRNPSAAFKRAIFASQTGEAFLLLITIEHASLAAPIRATSDAVNTVSNGSTFVPYPFRLELASEGEDASPRIRLQIDNVDRQIVQALREAGNTAPEVTVQVVLGSDPDTIEAFFPDFRLRAATYDMLVVDAELVLEDYTTLPYPYVTFTPSRFPGLFR